MKTQEEGKDRGMPWADCCLPGAQAGEAASLAWPHQPGSVGALGRGAGSGHAGCTGFWEKDSWAPPGCREEAPLGAWGRERELAAG